MRFAFGQSQPIAPEDVDTLTSRLQAARKRKPPGPPPGTPPSLSDLDDDDDDDMSGGDDSDHEAMDTSRGE